MNNQTYEGQKRDAEKPVFVLKRHNMLQQVSEDIPSKIGHFQRAYGGSLRAAVIAKCVECVWGETAAIRECKAAACPLFEQRPYQEIRNG